MASVDGPPFRVGGVGQLAGWRRHEVFEVMVLEGSGVAGDPFRHVTYFVVGDGRLVARFDPKERSDG